MPTPHKHAELIKAWADGAIIQVKSNSKEKWGTFQGKEAPAWNEDLHYRIKPEPQIIECWIDPYSMECNSYQKTNAYKHCTITIHPDE